MLKINRMKAIAIQADSKLIITTNKCVATISKNFMLSQERHVTIKESSIVSDFEILKSSIINPIGKIITFQMVIGIGEVMTIECEGNCFYEFGDVSLGAVVYSFEGMNYTSNMHADTILKPLIHQHIEEKFKPQIHSFYVESGK